MVRSICTATLSDALQVLSEEIAGKEAAGEANYIFCEDRLTLLAEQAVLKKSGGTLLSEVSTFARYLNTEKNKASVLSKEGSVMKINELIVKHKGDGCFTGPSARAVYETIAQLSASRVSAEDLRSAAEDTNGIHGMLQQKLRSLAVIFQEYEDFLHESGFIDESGYLSLLPETIRQGNLENVNVFFFAFPSFTKQALEGVKEAFRSAKSVTGIFIGGEEAVYTNRALNSFLRAAREEKLSVRETTAPSALSEEGQAFLKGACGAASGPASREVTPLEKRNSADLKRITQLIQEQIKKGERYVDIAALLPEAEDLLPAKREAPMKTKKIVLFEAQDETEEFEKIAALIKKHVSEGKRYRDIAVLVPGADYYLTVEKVLTSYKIPFYLERKRPLSEHPFSKYVLDILAGVAGRLSPSEADAIAANVCFGDADEYRNYLLRYRKFRGGATKDLKNDKEMEGFKQKDLRPHHDRMKEVLSLFPTGKSECSAFISGVRKLFEKTDWANVLMGLKADAGKDGDGFTPAEERFLEIGMTDKDAFGQILKEIESICGARKFNAREFASLFKSGLDANEVLLIPPTLDAVFVGDATECMFAATPELFAAGLTENLPVVSSDTAIISDKEIQLLHDKVEIEPAIKDVNKRKREGFILNLTSFTEQLYMSRPVCLHGKATQCSELLDFARKRFLTPPMPKLFPYDCSERVPAALNMIREGEKEGGQESIRYKAIHSALFDLGLEVTGERQHAPTPLAAQLWTKNDHVSPTLLEKYFECPYAGFMNKALYLAEQREGAMTKAESGNFVHAVLGNIATELKSIEQEEKLAERVREIIKAQWAESCYAALLETDEGKYEKERLEQLCLESATAAWEQIRDTDFDVLEAEKNFSIPALNIQGKPDRVDDTDPKSEKNGLVRVIDYKTGSFDASPIAYYTGRKLQLELYLQASASDDKQPAGAFYFSADDTFTKDGEKDKPPRYGLQGFYNADADCVSKFKTKPSGEGMNKDDFAVFLEYGYYVSQQAEEEMLSGNFAPSPYGSKCTWCNLKSLCAYTGKARFEGDKKSMKCRDIIDIVKEKKGE